MEDGEMKKITLVFLMLMLSGCIGGGDGAERRQLQTKQQ